MEVAAGDLRATPIHGVPPAAVLLLLVHVGRNVDAADRAELDQFSYKFDGTGADGARSEGGKRILRDNSRVYVRFLPFVGGRVHLGRVRDY